MPPRGLRKQSANQHNHRHENGLAPPGKKIERDRANSKQLKSNGHGHAHGHVNGGARPPGSPLARAGHPALGEQSSDGSSSENRVEHEGRGRAVEGQGRRESESSESVSEGLQNGTESPVLGADRHNNNANNTNSSDRENHGRIDVSALQDTAAQKNSSQGGMVVLSTVLSSCPLADSIALLIIILQVPSTILTLIYFLFTTMTLIPHWHPAVSTLPSLPAVLPNILSGDAGSPSFATTAFVDIACIVFWLFLGTPIQNLVVDCADVVIAVSLGSGQAGRRGGTRTGLLCLCIDMARHLAQRKGFRPSGLSFFSPTLSSPLPTSTTVASFIAQPESYISGSAFDKVRKFLAIHVTTQAVLRSVRSWILAHNMVSSQTTSKKVDPEAAPSTLGQADAKPGCDGGSHGAISTAPAQSGSSTPSAKLSREKPQSIKKRRKKAIRARSEQPVWAALASIKVNVMNSFERSRASALANTAHATDAKNLGSARFDEQEGSIWVTHIGSTSIYFGTSPRDSLESGGSEGPGQSSTNKDVDEDELDPLLVRVNGALWSSVSISPASEDLAGGRKRLACRWKGEIFGLAPTSTYQCDFVWRVDQAVIFSTTFTTQQAPSSLTASSHQSAPISQKPLRPSSPTTTLKNSITAANTTLQEEKTRQKRIRKEHKSNLNSLKKDVDSSSSRLSGSGGGDDRHRQRVLQLRQNIRQAEDVIGETRSELDTMGSIPEEDSQAWEEAKEAYETKRRNLDDLEGQLNDKKSKTDRKIASAESEASTANQKRERLQARLNKLQEQHDRITSAHAQGISSKEQMLAEKAIIAQRRQAWESGIVSEIGTMQTMIKQNTSQSQSMWQQIHAIETAVRDQQQPSLQQIMTPTSSASESMMTSSPTAPQDARLSSLPHLSAAAPPSGLSLSSLPPHHANAYFARDRSGSIISTASGPSGSRDTLDPTSQSPTVAGPSTQPIGTRPNRRISGNSDEENYPSSGSGSQRDPMSPVGKRSSSLSASNSVNKPKPPSG